MIEKLKEFLNISNPHTHRNVLAAIRHFFTVIDQKELVKDFKFRRALPSFNLTVPTLEQIREFPKYMTS